MLAAFIYRRACVFLWTVLTVWQVLLLRFYCSSYVLSHLVSGLFSFSLLSSLFSLHVLHRACMQVKKNLSDLRSFGLLRHGMLLSHGTYRVSSRFLASKSMLVCGQRIPRTNMRHYMSACSFIAPRL